MATHARPTSDSRLSAALLEEAERLGVDPNTIDKTALAAQIGKRWQEENAEAIASSNAWVERNGLPLERLRMF